MLDFSALSKAIVTLNEALEAFNNEELRTRLTVGQFNTLRAGVVQTFEFTYELSWKMIKRWLDMNLGAVYIDGVTRRELFRRAAEHQLIDDVDEWMMFHYLRNLTSHSYDEKVANEVCEGAKRFSSSAQTLLTNLEAQND
jgi:nucleotidyltransferase substrate binding protein (TIGR01987 family)